MIQGAHLHTCLKTQGPECWQEPAPPPTEEMGPRKEMSHASWAPLFSHLKRGGGWVREWGVEAALLMGACLPLAWMTNHPKAPPGPLVITGGRQELPGQPPDS